MTDVEEVPDRARLHQYCVSDGKIYATTYSKKDNKTEMLVLDQEGPHPQEALPSLDLQTAAAGRFTLRSLYRKPRKTL
jgi:hypothetical protein